MKLASISALAIGRLVSAGVAIIAEAATGSISNGPFPEELNGSNFTYPFPVSVFSFRSQQQELEMAFMDIEPSSQPNGKTVVLLHGKNFCGPTWIDTIEALAGAGYRVVAPDQVGFCKSSKPPDGYQFSLNQLAWNTRGLLDALGIGSVTVVGHSLGGMLSTRFALQYPETVERLVLVDPVGLEDYVEKGVPYIAIDASIASEAASSHASIRGYEQDVYYVGQWQPSYDIWVSMLVNIYHGRERSAYVRNQAQIVDMVLTSPVSHYFKHLKPKTLLVVGDKDRTAIGSQWAPPDVAAGLGHFDVLGPEVAAQMADCTLIRFPDLGHAPQLSDPAAFQRLVLDWLAV